MSSYSMAWRSIPWQPLVASAPSFSRAVSNGTAREIAEVQEPGPGVFEIAIAHKDVPRKQIVVFIGATDSLREAAILLVSDGGDLRGFLDHAIKEKHVIWLRTKPTKTHEDAIEFRDKALGQYDYAWVQQTGARARSLVALPSFLCCGCWCRTGVNLRDGPPKFVQPKSEGLLSKLTSSISGRKR